MGLNIRKHWRLYFKNELGAPNHINIYEKGYCDSKQHIVKNAHSIQESLELSQQEVLRKVTYWMSKASG